MFRSKSKSLVLAVVLIGMVFVCVAQTQAHWGRWHRWHRWGWGYPVYTSWYTPYYTSWYGYYGSCCYSPCYTSYCYSCCSYSCCDPCCGSTVTTYRAPTEAPKSQSPTPAPPRQEQSPPAQPPTPPVPEGSDQQTKSAVSDDSGLLTIRVPAEAQVYVNGYKTKSTGAVRQYVSNGLKPGFSYKYEIRAEMVRDGRLVEDTQVIYLTAGATERVAFSLDTKPAERLATIW